MQMRGLLPPTVGCREKELPLVVLDVVVVVVRVTNICAFFFLDPLFSVSVCKCLCPLPGCFLLS